MILSLVVLLEVLISAGANCVSDCNMNGYCTINDKCICYNGLDGFPAFTGYDCSERTCPRYVD